MKTYGLPYQGSKNRIAKWIVESLPDSPVFVDLFFGGGAVTHRALEIGKYNEYIANDLQALPSLFVDIARGNYNERIKKWISREDFKKLKGSDLLIKYMWSFSNSGDSYLYSVEKEPLFKALHYDLVLNDPSLLLEFGIVTDGSIKDIKKNSEEYLNKYIDWFSKNVLNIKEKRARLVLKTDEERRDYLIKEVKSKITTKQLIELVNNTTPSHYFSKSQWYFPTRESYEIIKEVLNLPLEYEECTITTEQKAIKQLQKTNINRIGSFGRINRLKRLKDLEVGRIQTRQQDYRSINEPRATFYYCDPPYKATKGYENGFDYEAFEEWLATTNKPCIISDASCPRGCVLIDKTVIRNLQGGAGGSFREEGLYIQKRFKPWYDEEMKKCRK